MNATTSVVPVPTAAPDVRRWLILSVVLAGTFMAILDASIVNVAIPSIQRGLHASFGSVELVITAYVLTYACLLVTGGRLGDMHGRKRMFIIGLVLFLLASALCGAAPTVGVLVGARALQGIGAGLFFPQILAIVQITFSGKDRVQALGIFGSIIGLSAIAGQLIGGVLLAVNVAGLTWRPTFLVNVPIGIAAVIAAIVYLPKDQPGADSRLDPVGVGLIALSLVLLIVPLLEGRDNGWPVWMLVCLVASVPVAAVFVRYERKLAARGGSPLLRLELFKHRGFSAGIPIAALYLASYTSFLFLMAVYLQIGLGFSPLRSGLIYAPTAAGFFLASLAAPRIVPLLGRHVLSIGYGVAAIGVLGTAATAWSAGAHVAGWELAPFLLVTGVGQGLGMTPLIGTVIAGLAPKEAGAASGVVTTTLQVGNALGVAIGGLVFFAILGHGHPGVAYARAFARTIPISAAFLIAAAILVHRIPKGPQEANPLIERLPGWAAGFAYSMYLMTGGRAGDQFFNEVLGRVAERRSKRTEQAPLPIGEFLVFHFNAEREDEAFFNYLLREALTYGTSTVPHEDIRMPVIQAQVDEIRRRQDAGLLPAAMDADLLRLFALAVTQYPRMLAQVTRMTTGLGPHDPRFEQRWTSFLRELGERLSETVSL